MKFLFDLDGTLLYKSSSLPTIKQLVFSKTLETVFGVPDIDYMQYPIHGETDRSILRMILREKTIPDMEIEKRESYFWSTLEKHFIDALKNRDPLLQEYSLLPGVTDFLEQTLTVRKGIATGNIEFFAWYKLEQTGIKNHFSFGGFGDDGVHRIDLVRQAIRRSGASDGESFFLFGDTPKDISAGIEAGCIVCAVATGSYSQEELMKHVRPGDAVFDGFVNVQAILNFCRQRISEISCD